MKILTMLLGFFALRASPVAAESFWSVALSDSEAEFVEAMAVSFLIVCVYLLFWLKNKGQY